MNVNRKRGDLGEETAERFLISRGYRIAERNYSSRYGEIDIIAEDEKYIVFAEVKTRGDLSHGLPREAVGRAKQRRIILTAYAYMAQSGCRLQPRFDVIEVYITRSAQPKVVRLTHLKNAFEMNGEEDYALF